MTRAETREASNHPTVDFDHHSAEFRENNYAIMDDLRARCPVAFTESHGGFWVLSDYASVAAALSDDALFSSCPSVGIPASVSPAPILPIETDPPLTKELRAITTSDFSPSAATRLEPKIREIATELIDAFIERGECDIVAELTTPLPARIILVMLDFDESRWAEWVDCVHSLVHDRTDDPAKAQASGEKIFVTIAEEMERRKRDGFGDDLLSHIMQGTIEDGRPLEAMEVLMYTMLMFLGGMDTTSGLAGNALARLAEDVALRQRLIDDRGLLRSATEEFLRHDTPTQCLSRNVTRDAEFFGQQLKKGDQVMMMFASANRDPAVFDRPEEIDFDRVRNKHVAFGIGMHRCLGSNLARTMFQVMIDEILTRLPDFAVTGPGERFPDGGEVYALRHLPIAFTPGPRRSASAHAVDH